MSLSARVRYLEERWAYFLLFGMPSTALCLLGNSLANAALFGLTFPAVRLSRNTPFRSVNTNPTVHYDGNVCSDCPSASLQSSPTDYQSEWRYILSYTVTIHTHPPAGIQGRHYVE